jgi:hypothetical protein
MLVILVAQDSILALVILVAQDSILAQAWPS